MKKIIFTNLDGSLSVVYPVEKQAIERAIGELSDADYEDHVLERCVPKDALNVRWVEEDIIPRDREFRNAWCDTQPGEQIDICCVKARDIKLKELREHRDAELKKTDITYAVAVERGEDTNEIKAYRQNLRDATEPLKALDVEGKYNDEQLINQIKELSILSNVI